MLIERFETRVKQFEIPSEVLSIHKNNQETTKKTHSGLFSVTQNPGGGRFRGDEHDHTSPVLLAFAVAAAGGVGDGIEAGECTVYDGKVHIHTRLHLLSADDPGRHLVLQSHLDIGDHHRPVCAAHGGG